MASIQKIIQDRLAGAYGPWLLQLDTSRREFRERRKYAACRFGHWGTVGAIAAMLLPVVGDGDLQRSHWNINTWSDQEILDWKTSHLSQCNAIAVAVSVLYRPGV
jgi:hypothetical protein